MEIQIGRLDGWPSLPYLQSRCPGIFLSHQSNFRFQAIWTTTQTTHFSRRSLKALLLLSHMLLRDHLGMFYTPKEFQNCDHFPVHSPALGDTSLQPD
jgi:hypothetical protein